MPTLSELRVRATYDQKDFKAALDQSKADMRETGRVIKQEADAAETAVKSSTTKIGSAYAALPMAARKAYDEAINAQRDYQAKLAQGMTQVGVALSVGITAPFALFARDSVQLAASFEQTMDVLQASIQGTARDMAALRQEAVRLGSDITLPAVSAVDAARAMNQLAKGGLAVADTLKAARGTMQLAAATGTDAAEAATIQARALSAFNLEGEKASHVADLLAKSTYSATGTIQDLSYALQMSSAVMHQAGQTIDETVTALTLMAKAGMVGSDAGTSLKTMFMRLMEGSTMEKARDLMKGYGIEIYDASGAMKDMRSIIAEFAPLMQNLTEKQRNAALAIIFGADAVRAANIVLGGGVEAFDAMTDKLEQEGAAADLAAARNKGLAGAIDGLKSAWETLAQQSADTLLVPLADATRAVAGFVGTLATMDPAARGVILTLGALAAAAGPVLIIAGQLKTAWITLFGIRAAATAAAATAAAAETALAAAEQAQAVAAAEAATANSALAVSNEAVAVTAGQAAVATGAASVATGTAAGSTGLLAGAMTALSGPVGLVVIGVTALAAAMYGLHRWATEEERQAKANAEAFAAEFKSAYEDAKAKNELAKKSKSLLAEYLELEKQTDRTNEQQRRYKQLANDLSLLIPQLVTKYDSQGQAILDIAKAHKEAALQAQNHYEKEEQLAKSRLNILDSMSAKERAAAITGQMTSTYGGHRYTSAQDILAAARDVAKTQPHALGLLLNEGPLRDAVTQYGQAYSLGKNTALLEARVLRLFAELQDELRKAEADAAKLKREADDLRRQAQMSPAEYKRYMQQRQRAENEARWKQEAEDEKKRQSYQADRDAWFKAHGYSGIDELSKGGGSARSVDDHGLTAKVLEAMARKINTPEGAASCGFFAMQLLKQTGAQVGTGRYGGGALDLIQRVRRGGGIDVTADQAKPGDLVYYYGAQYGAQKDAQGKGYHVGVYEGGGYVIDSSGGRTRTRHALNAGAHFIRPMRLGSYGNQGDLAMDALQQAEQEAKRQAEEVKRQQEEVQEAYAKTRVAIASLLDPNVRYAELLGMQLDRYKQLAPEEKARAERLHGLRSAALTERELARMKEGGAIEGITDPTERAVAQYRMSLRDRNDLSDADKARLIEAKRAELVKQRADEIAKEVKRLADEKALVEAITEQDRIRLRLQMSRPGLKPDELNQLAKAEYDKFLAEQKRQVREELGGKAGTLEAANAQLAHDRALHEIAANLQLTEERRYQLIQDQNDALRLQLYTIEQMARVQAEEITPEQAQQLIQAEQLQIQAERANRDQIEQTRQLEIAQEALNQKQKDRMDAMAEAARSQAESLADIIMRPFEDGMEHGLKGFWNSLLDGWRQTIRQMFLEWAKSQLMRSFEPLFEGRALRQYRADQAAAQAQRDAGQAELLRAAKEATQAAARIAPGETNGVPNGMSIGGRLDPMMAMASLAMLMGGGGKRNLLSQLTGIVGLLGAFGAFGKGGFLSRLRFASGGDMPYGMPALVGEFGPELWTPPASGGRIHNAQDTQRMLSTPTVINVNMPVQTPDTIGFKRSSKQIASTVSEELSRAMRRNFVGR